MGARLASRCVPVSSIVFSGALNDCRLLASWQHMPEKMGRIGDEFMGEENGMNGLSAHTERERERFFDGAWKVGGTAAFPIWRNAVVSGSCIIKTVPEIRPLS